MIRFVTLVCLSLLSLAGYTTALDRCPVPSRLKVENVTPGEAQVSWITSDSVLQVDLQWKKTADQDWLTLIDAQSPVVLDNLEPCMLYEVRLLSICDGTESDFSRVITFAADGCCRIPTGITLAASDDNSAQLTWDLVEFAFSHHVRYRASGDKAWIESETDTNNVTIDGLESCTQYEFAVGSQCDLDSTEFSETFAFETSVCEDCSDLIYCTSAADDASQEWIDSLAFGFIRYQSGNNEGYLFASTESTGLERKRPYTFHIKPATTSGVNEFALRMWIDLNQDGMFTDSTELLVDSIGPIQVAGYTQTIAINDSVMLGETRMRVALKAIIGQDTLPPSACGNFLFGEVEDYCLRIDDRCPEVRPVLLSHTETSAVIGWPPVEEAIVFVYRHANVEDMIFNEPMLTMDTLIEITGLGKCNTYVLATLSVCVQDTSSWYPFEFNTECPNGVNDFEPIAAEVSLYPNPFTDVVTMELSSVINGNAVVRMLTLYGQEVASQRVMLEEQAKQVVVFEQLDMLSHGMYLVLLESGNRRQAFKLVK